MFFLYDMFQDGNALTPTGNNQVFDTLTITDGIFDHLNLLNAIPYPPYTTDPMHFDTTIPQAPNNWTEYTVLDCNFKGTINGGTINQFIGYVDYIAVQRQEEGSDEWITLQKIYKNSQTGTLNSTFVMDDTYEKNNTKYTYRIVPVDNNGNMGLAQEIQVLSIFNEAYIADASHIYKITYEYAISNAQKIQKDALYEPYGSKYPFVAFNAVTDYDEYTITAILLAPTSQSLTNAYIDRNAQVKLINEFNTWLTNGKAKILKDFNGNLKVGVVRDAVSNSYYKELGNGLASTSFNFTEIGGFNQKDLDNLGMTSQFPLQYKL